MQRNNKRLGTTVIKQFLLISTIVTSQIAVFFLFAGKTVGIRPWIFFVSSFLYYSLSLLVQYKLNPELLVRRLKIRGEGSKSWDLALVRGTNLTVIVLIPTVAGLDIGRFRWSSLDASYAVLGLVLFFISIVIVNWAMSMNQFFEPSVRIQKDREHQVITSGPYRIVRHPGYSGGILNTLSIPLIIGSLFTLLPAGIYVG